MLTLGESHHRTMTAIFYCIFQAIQSQRYPPLLIWPIIAKTNHILNFWARISAIHCLGAARRSKSSDNAAHLLAPLTLLASNP